LIDDRIRAEQGRMRPALTREDKAGPERGLASMIHDDPGLATPRFSIPTIWGRTSADHPQRASPSLPTSVSATSNRPPAPHEMVLADAMLREFNFPHPRHQRDVNRA
jgi:hypothetical protein